MQQSQNIHVTRNHVRLVDQYLVRDPLRELETGRVWGRHRHFLCHFLAIFGVNRFH